MSVSRPIPVLLTLVLCSVQEALAAVQVEPFTPENAVEGRKIAYFIGIRERIQKRADDKVLRRSPGGDVKISVTLGRDGQIKAMRVAESSGNGKIDETAQKIIQEAAPFDPFPQELDEDEFELVVPMTFPRVPATVLDWLFN